MKRLFLDTNFLLDLFVREGFKENAQKVLDLCIDNDISFYVSFLSVANFAYIMRKTPTELLRRYINEICLQFHVLPNNAKNLQEAAKLETKDFEDAVQYQSALMGKCECIITRDKKGFEISKLPVYSPLEFINLRGLLKK